MFLTDVNTNMSRHWQEKVVICQWPTRAVTSMRNKNRVRGGRGTELFESKEELKSKHNKGGGEVQTNNRRI